MDPRQPVCIVRVAELGSFTHDADARQLSQQLSSRPRAEQERLCQ